MRIGFAGLPSPAAATALDVIRLGCTRPTSTTTRKAVMERDSSAPRAWINQRVAVELHDAMPSGVDVATGRGVFDTRSGTLKGANEFGIDS